MVSVDTNLKRHAYFVVLCFNKYEGTHSKGELRQHMLLDVSLDILKTHALVLKRICIQYKLSDSGICFK